MAASAQVQALNLVFWARKQAAATSTTAAPVTVQQVLDAITLAAGSGFADGGTRLVSTSLAGKSVSFQVDSDLSLSDLMEALRQADALVATYSTDQLTTILTAPRSAWGQVGFC